GVQPYREVLSNIFGPHNREFVRALVARITELEGQGPHLAPSTTILVTELTKLRFFERVFQRPDEAQTKTEAETEQSILRALLALNTEADDAEGASMAEVKHLPGVPTLVRLMLITHHATYDLSQDETHEVIMGQLAKFIQLFRFLEADPEYTPLLTAFLRHFDCANWEEYARRIFALLQPVLQMLKGPGWMIIEVKPGAEFASDCTFLDHFILAEGTSLIQEDFLSTREFPLYKVQQGKYVIVYPRFVVELLHKGLFFRLKKLNESAKPRLLGKKDWGSLYKKSFSEESLLVPALNAMLKPRGLALSGKEIEDSGALKKLNNGEPDYYFRRGKRVILLESKDVNVNKDVKTGEKFSEFVEAMRKKFYRPSSEPINDVLRETAVLQLLNNIRRLLAKQLPFDTDYNPKNLIFYPLVVVHDRSFMMPGLNVLVNSWFQEQVAYLRQLGMFGGTIKPLVLVDIDTVLAYQDHMANADNRLVLWDALEAYYDYLQANPRQYKARGSRPLSGQEQLNLAKRQATSFPDFLADYAGRRLKLPALSETQRQLIEDFLKSSAYNQKIKHVPD
ncbi:hypothetical protein LGH70_22260, partial [Hymenobacter sp. BT635]